MGELNNPYNNHSKPTQSMEKVNQSMKKKNPTSADIWETFVTEFSDATDDLSSAVNMDNLLIDMYELGFTQDD